MACLATEVTLLEAIQFSTITTLLYVGVLYLPFNAGPRDSRPTIISRLTSLLLLSLLLETYVRRRIPNLNYISSFAIQIRAISIASFLTLLLYAGHLLATPFAPRPRAARHLQLRNYIAGPLLEEAVFRRQTLLLWSCQPATWQILFPASMFALAHLHHIRRIGYVALSFQLAYTFLFGIYAAALYINTHSIGAPIAAHVICNVIELPDFVAIFAHRKCTSICIIYALSILLFAVSFAPLTAMVRSRREHWLHVACV